MVAFLQIYLHLMILCLSWWLSFFEYIWTRDFFSKFILWLGFANICATNGVPNRYSGCLLQIYLQLMVFCQIFIVALFVNIFATNGLVPNIHSGRLLQTYLQQMVLCQICIVVFFCNFWFIGNVYSGYLSRIYLQLMV